MPSDLTLQQIAAEMESLTRLVAEKVRQGDELAAILRVVIARYGDLDYVTIKEAAVLEQALYGRGSIASVRRKLERGVYTLVKRPGEKAGKIAVAQIRAVYRAEFLPIATWRKAHEAGKRER